MNTSQMRIHSLKQTGHIEIAQRVVGGVSVGAQQQIFAIGPPKSVVPNLRFGTPHTSQD